MDIIQNPRPTTLKSINKRRFLEILRRRGPSTRAELTRASGVTPPTSSSIIADLMEAGFLERSISRSLDKGRRGTFFRLADSKAYVMGATIDVAHCTASLAGLDGVPRDDLRFSFATPPTYEALVQTLAAAYEELTAGVKAKCLGVGLSVPGLWDERNRQVAFSPNLHMLDGHSLEQDLSGQLEVNVVCTQEEHALCLSEQNRGAESLANFAVVDFSYGVGMGAVINGRYVSGAHGYAGEVGHTTVEPNGLLCGCGNRGCLETVASDTALIRRLSARLGVLFDFEAVSVRWRDGDPVVRQEVDQVLDYIAIGLATVVNVLNPQVLFVNGSVFNLGEDVLEKLKGKIEARALKPSFKDVTVHCATGNKLHGALIGLLDRVFAEVGPVLS